MRGVNRAYLTTARGREPALAVEHRHVTKLHHGLRDTPFKANWVVDALSRILNAAEDFESIPEASNPCRLVVKFRERARDRWLIAEEFRRLGRVLVEAESCKGFSMHAVAAICPLLLTGCRKGEILNLRWSEVDLQANELRVPDTTTGGPRTISLSPRRLGCWQRSRAWMATRSWFRGARATELLFRMARKRKKARFSDGFGKAHLESLP